MKKLLVLLPILLLVLIAGVAFSRPEPAESTPNYPQRRFWESFPRSGIRLGVVLADDEPGSRKGGVRVERVVPDSPADQAGLKDGDVILRLDGERVSSPRDVREYLKGMDEPKEMQVEIERDGKPLTIQVTPEKRDVMRMAFGGGVYLGVNLQELDKDLASYFQVDPNAGVLVTRVEPNSPAEKAGLRSGDVLTHVNGEKIGTPSDVVNKLDDVNEGDSLEITILRHGSEKKLTAQPEKREGFMGEMPDMPEIHRMLRDNPEFQQGMDDLHKQMDQLREEMQMRKDDLRKMKDEIQDEVHRQMEQLRKELKERKDET